MTDKIKIIRQTCVAGKQVVIDQELNIPADISKGDAATLIRMKKAEPVKEEKVPDKPAATTKQDKPAEEKTETADPGKPAKKKSGRKKKTNE